MQSEMRMGEIVLTRRRGREDRSVKLQKRGNRRRQGRRTKQWVALAEERLVDMDRMSLFHYSGYHALSLPRVSLLIRER